MQSRSWAYMGVGGRNDGQKRNLQSASCMDSPRIARAAGRTVGQEANRPGSALALPAVCVLSDPEAMSPSQAVERVESDGACSALSLTLSGVRKEGLGHWRQAAKKQAEKQPQKGFLPKAST